MPYTRDGRPVRVGNIPGPEPGGMSHEPHHVVDIAATIIDVAATAYPKEYAGQAILPLERESFVPIFKGGRWTRSRPIAWEHEGNRAVRSGQWKLVSRHPGAWELYDMQADRTEPSDLASGEAARVARMSADYAQWADRCGVVDWETLRRGHGGGAG